MAISMPLYQLYTERERDASFHAHDSVTAAFFKNYNTCALHTMMKRITASDTSVYEMEKCPFGIVFFPRD